MVSYFSLECQTGFKTEITHLLVSSLILRTKGIYRTEASLFYLFQTCHGRSTKTCLHSGQC